MNIIETKINQKLGGLNDNGKIQFIFKILQHIFQNLPDLEKISANVLTKEIEQLLSVIKYILLTNNSSLQQSHNQQISTIQQLQQENNKLQQELNKKKEDLKIMHLEKQELNNANEILKNIDKLKSKIKIPKQELSTIINQFQHLDFLYYKTPELKSIHLQCKKSIEKFTEQLNSIIVKKEEVESILRGKINEV